jgi:hypothetical protein
MSGCSQYSRAALVIREYFFGARGNAAVCAFLTLFPAGIRIESFFFRQTETSMHKEMNCVEQKDGTTEEMRDLKTHEAAMTDRHETRHTAEPVTIEPGRAPSRYPAPDDPR